MEPEISLPHSQVPATVPILNQLDPLHTTTSHLMKIHLNIIFPSTSDSPKWSLSFRLPYQNRIYSYPVPHTCYMSRLSHSSRVYHPHNIGIIKLLVMQFSSLSCYPIPHRPKYSPQHPILKHSHPTFFPQYERLILTPIQNNG